MPLHTAFVRPRLHHEAVDWQNRVITAGGTVTVATLNAVSDFCRAIDAANIRGRFYRLNLMCGDFTAALVPLFRGESFSGTQQGNTTDTNNNFVSGDYSETGSSTGGLKGNGSTKYLDTGLNPVTISASSSDFHLAVYAKGASATGTTRCYIGNAIGAASNESFIGITGGGATENAGIACAGVERRTAPSGTKEGLLLVTTNGSRAQTYYLNGTASATTTASGTFSNTAFFVFRASTFYALAQYMRGYSIGLGLSSTQEASYRAALEAFNDALTRKV